MNCAKPTINRAWNLIAFAVLIIAVVTSCTPQSAEVVSNPKDNLFSFFQLPEDCSSLCWWQITPGEPFTPHLEQLRKGGNGIYDLRQVESNPDAAFYAWRDRSSNSQFSVETQDGNVLLLQMIIGPEPNIVASDHWPDVNTLPNFIQAVGAPDSYSIDHQSNQEGTSRRVKILLHYAADGIAISFNTPTQYFADMQGELTPQPPHEAKIGSLFILESSIADSEWVDTIGLFYDGIYPWESIDDIKLD